MRRFVLLFIGASLVASLALAEDGSHESVPTTVHGGNQKIKKGGREIGAGFRHLGRGIKKVFTGERSKEEFKQTKEIGTGAADLGKGIAGVGRGVGRNIKNGTKGDQGASTKPKTQDDDQSHH